METGENLSKKNNIVLVAIIVSCILFVCVFFLEKSKYLFDIIPMFRGEVSLNNDMVITTTNSKLPIIVKKNDPFMANQLRFFGNIKSDFAKISDFLCRNGDVVIEVGSYFGYNSITLGNRLRGNGKLYAFEPNAHIFSFLKKSVMLNDLENTVVLHNVAVSNKQGVCDIEDVFHLAKTKNGSVEQSRPISVNCIALDSAMEKINKKPVDLLLIDVPGQEFQIIDGASEIIKKSPNITIIMMFSQQESSQSVNVYSEIENLIKQGFRFYWCDDKKKIYPLKATPEDIIEKNKAILIISRKQF
ncbi:MAG: FkbM family methyltransferase [Holosporaceae bacterium]|nr:FkbM family methyltransferase [Holosporaceae bacterium]